MATRQQALTASGVIYLFADQFVRGFDLSPAEEEQRVYDVGEEVPCSEAQVDARALAEEVTVAAYIELEQRGYIQLTLLTPPDATADNAVAEDLHVHVSQLQPERGTHGLEEALLKAMTTFEAQNTVHEITWRAIGEEDAFPGDFLIKLVQEGLHHTDIYDVQLRPGNWLKRLVAGATVRVVNCERVAQVRGRVDDVKRMLAEFRRADPALDAILRRQIGTAIRSRFVASIDGKPQPDEV